jgi:hypothetical protein
MGKCATNTEIQNDIITLTGTEPGVYINDTTKLYDSFNVGKCII